ncbi:hypothetical protein EI94DRAFT_1645154 [Lactarius quietus]|nr:hypothetical protein EI94DRAFT_1645154 [Lactarius quietus]
MSSVIVSIWICFRLIPIALALADNAAFCNTLISMRPKSTSADLPSSYDVKVHLHNQFVKHMRQLKAEITVSGRPL